MKIRVMVLGIVAGAAIALTPTHTSAQQGQARMQGQMEMQGQMQDLTERERLERMREHMVDGMRRMAVGMDAVQKRIAAIDRGEPDAAPPVEGMMGMGMGRGHAMGQGQAMGHGQGQGMGQGQRARDGSAPGCPNMQPAEDGAPAEQGGGT